MLKRILPLLLLFASSLPLFAQQKPKDDFEISDIPEEEARPYFGFGGGFNMQLLQLNYDEINKMTKSLGIPALSGGMLMTGASGFISSPFGKHLRIGGTGAGGTICQSADVSDTINGTPTTERRTITFNVGGAGVTLEYVVPFEFTRNKLVLIGGAMLGAGSMSVQLNQITSDPLTWNGFFTGGKSTNFQRQVQAAYFGYEPYLNLEYSLFPFLMIRGSIGYHGTVVGTWTQDLSDAISGVPAITGNGVIYGGGVFLGIFR